MNKKTIFVVIMILSFLSACAAPTTQATSPTQSSTAVTTQSGYPAPVTPTPKGAYPPPTTQPTSVSSTPTETSALTPAQQAAVDEVSKRYNIPVEQIKVVSTEAVTWPNGCLGVVIPGVMCTDVVIEGFRIKLEANGQQFEMHTNKDGSVVIDAAQQLATLGFVVFTSAQQIQIVNPNIPLGPTYNPAFNGFLPTGGAISGTAYVYDNTGGTTRVVAIDSAGSKELSFIQNPTYGLAIWRGGLGTSPLLAWGTAIGPDKTSSSLMIAAPDGSQLQTLLTIDSGNITGALQIVAEAWSMDGQSLYFSEEPIGIGGYIIFDGATSLYKIDIKTKEVTEIIPASSDLGKQVGCLDAISGDYRFIADHCSENVITIRDLQGGTSVTITPPPGVTGYRLFGNARFSPDGSQVAYALAKGNPEEEQGWVAVGPSTGGVSKLVVAGEDGTYYLVKGWLDDKTLLIQANSINTPSPNFQLFTVSVDGSNLTKVADGSLLAIIDNR